MNLEDALEKIQVLEVAFKSEQKSREKAEQILEEKASSLFKVNSRLHEQYLNSTKTNHEIDYLLRITSLEEDESSDNISIVKKFLKMSFDLKKNSILWTIKD